MASFKILSKEEVDQQAEVLRKLEDEARQRGVNPELVGLFSKTIVDNITGRLS